MNEAPSFIPATFDLYEFDDHGYTRLGSATIKRRWLSHWDGLIGKPAEEVTLAWSDGASTALVCTSGRSYDEARARSRAMYLALGGDELPIANRPESAAAIHEEIERVSSRGELWSQASGIISKGLPVEATTCNGFSVAFSRLSNEIVFIAAVNIDLHQFRVRRVRTTEAYAVTS
jgi:hypothetical protein